jgi:nucleotide-binding universal stress UspA family protein
MLDRVLVPLENAPGAEAILPILLRFVPRKSWISLLHVAPGAEGPDGKRSLGHLTRVVQAQSYLDGVRKKFPQVRGRIIVESGDPATRIVQAALQVDAGLIALASHTASEIGSEEPGRVLRGVIRRSWVPVLTCSPNVPPRAGRAGRILVPVTDSADSRRILDSACLLAAATRAELVVLHVSPWDGRRDDRPDGTPPLERLVRRLQDRGVQARLFTAAGDLVWETLEYARSLEAELIAASAPASEGSEGWIPELIRAAERPVLVRRVLRVPALP